jgi:hypothetical protein
MEVWSAENLLSAAGLYYQSGDTIGRCRELF